MDKFQAAQRVVVRKTENGVILAPPEPGTVRRIKINEPTAFIDLDVRVERDGVHPYPASDERRAKCVVAYPEDCDSLEGLVSSQKLCLVPIERFGRDHRSTLLYIESRCVDHGGKLIDANMRCNGERHPGHENRGSWDSQYGTRLDDGTVLEAHDDWDCVDDLRLAGLIEHYGHATNLTFHLTNAGYAMAAKLRRERAERAFAETKLGPPPKKKAAAKERVSP